MTSTLAPPPGTRPHRLGSEPVRPRPAAPATTIAPASASTAAPTAAPARQSRVRPAARWRRFVTPAVAVAMIGVITWFAWSNWARINPAGWIGELRWWWAGLALVASGGTLAGNALNLMGSTTVPLRFGRTMAVQSTGTVARLVSPASVGGSAVNVAYLRRLGVRTPTALTAVGISHAVQFVSTTLMLLVVMVWMGNTPVRAGLPSERFAAIGSAIVLALVGVAVVVVRQVPALRTRVIAMLREVRRSLATLLMHPRRAALAFGGSVLISVALTASLWASAHAFGAHLGLGSALLILLLGSTAGGLIPVPGGIGAIDACLVAALTASGIGLAVAVPTVALFRLATMWLHLPVGLAAGAVLRRRGLL